MSEQKEPQAQAQAQEPQQPQGNTPNPDQNVETQSYVPTYEVKAKLKDDILKAIGDRPFNEIAGLINAVNVKELDHNTLTQVINALGQFPYTKVAGIIQNINSYVKQKVED